MTSVYFDHNATTPIDPRVRDAMLPWLGELHGNASSSHVFGRAAKHAVDLAGDQIAELLGARTSELVLTASGTEANNAALFAVARQAGYSGHVVYSLLEHPSIQAAATRVAEQGMTITEVTPNADGVVEVDTVMAALRPETRLVSLMLANNELGTLQPVAEVAAICRERGIAVLCDAVQAVGKIPVNVTELRVDYLSLGGHKFHGPPGIAALWVRPGAVYEPFLVGGSQQSGRRASTLNVPAIVGLGKACELARQELDERQAQLRALRDRFEDGLTALGDSNVHCRMAPRLPHTSNVAFPGLLAHHLQQRLDAAGFAVSTGAACHDGEPKPSRALVALGLSEKEALASLRVSFGITNTDDEVERFLSALKKEVTALRLGATGALIG